MKLTQKKVQLIVYLMVFLGALAVMLHKMHFNVNYEQYPDSVLYSNIGQNFLSGKGLVNTIRNRDYVVGPIFPMFLAFVYAVAGVKNYVAVVVFQCILSAFTILLSYKICTKLSGNLAGVIAFILLAITTTLSTWTNWLLTETLYTFFITLFAYLVVSYSLRAKAGKYRLLDPILIGLVIGLTNLTRPLLIFIFPFLLLNMLLNFKWQWRKSLKDVIIVGVVCALAMCPWAVRNYLRYHQFIAVTNYGGFEFYCGNNPHTDTTHTFSSGTYQFFYDSKVVSKIGALPVQESEKVYTKLAEQYILQHPILFVKRTLAKEFNVFWKPLNKVDCLVLILGIFSLLLAFRFKKYGFLILLTLYYASIVSVFTIAPNARYRAPIMPLVIVLGSLLITSLLKPLFLKLTKSKYLAGLYSLDDTHR